MKSIRRIVWGVLETKVRIWGMKLCLWLYSRWLQHSSSWHEGVFVWIKRKLVDLGTSYSNSDIQPTKINERTKTSPYLFSILSSLKALLLCLFTTFYLKSKETSTMVSLCCQLPPLNYLFEVSSTFYSSCQSCKRISDMRKEESSLRQDSAFLNNFISFIKP